MPERDVDGWYLATIRYFRGMGFFARFVGMKDEELSARLKSTVIQQWDVPFPEIGQEDPQAADMCLLMTDSDRIWYQDLECVLPGERSYVSALQRWSAISRGAFKPEDITEAWRGNRGSVDVAFKLNGRKYTFKHGGGDMIDMSIIRMVNGLIKSTGYSF
jgi:hypothetical protein